MMGGDQSSSTLDSKTDVLIIGAGPSGLMAAYWMARYGVNARIIDKRSTKVFTGHADGLRMRTLELFDSMGIQHRVMQEGYSAVEANFWAPDENGLLTRQKSTTPQPSSRSPFHHMLLSQGRIERFIIDSISQHSDIKVERGVIAESLEFDEKLLGCRDEYPITVCLRTPSNDDTSNGIGANGGGANGSTSVMNELEHSAMFADDSKESERQYQREVKTERIKAKYIIGCDGAHSWTRKQLEIPFEGSSTDHIWGVIDIIPITNFPDIRRVCVVTNTFGTILVIPRERNLVRLYVPVQVIDTATEGRFDRSTVTPDLIKARVQEILSSYTFDYSICEWWTAYQVGQRMAPTFAKGDRMFLAGDAVHTHSPKMGLGMNVSMQDAFNIGWKVALVVTGAANPSILATYDTERHRLAAMLLDFDRHWSVHFESDRVAEVNAKKAETMVKIAEDFAEFSDGFKAFYSASELVWRTSLEGSSAAPNLIPGERFIAAKLRNQADGTPQWTTRIFESDGRFRLVIMAGDVRDEMQKQRVAFLSHYLSGQNNSKFSFLKRYTPVARFESAIDIVTIHSAPWGKAEFFDFPEVLRPFDPRTGWDYSKIWTDDLCMWDLECDGKGYEQWGVDRSRGVMVIVRPDQYIGWVGELEEVYEMTRYLDGVLVKRSNYLIVEDFETLTD
ncbi:hypothetical protein N7495_003165 [Penicillium taxi]|uniref:uncharacterized protein n=1 Tax=Penicillium taxi TaxID=168475 RepID=UPI002545873A|nr:uncharacterized protein N7495_003165 [Penicillium taxi]KAJ5902637.1 hypothetical protein N7495_003165 [Penicillium taxi]